MKAKRAYFIVFYKLLLQVLHTVAQITVYTHTHTHTQSLRALSYTVEGKKKNVEGGGEGGDVGLWGYGGCRKNNTDEPHDEHMGTPMNKRSQNTHTYIQYIQCTLYIVRYAPEYTKKAMHGDGKKK